jgi:proteic killer suppression protein
VDFADRGTRDLYNGIASKAARRVIPAALRQKAADKLTLLDAAVSLDQLRIPPGNRLETLHGDRAGQPSIRINDRYCVCFRWTETGPVDVEIVDYHD